MVSVGSSTPEPKRAAITPAGTDAQRNAAPAGDVAPAVRAHIRAGGDAQLWTQAPGGLSATASTASAGQRR